MLQCRVERQVGRVNLNPILNQSDGADIVTRPIFRSVRLQRHCNSIDLKSVRLQRASTMYRSNRISPWTGIQLDRWTLLCEYIIQSEFEFFSPGGINPSVLRTAGNKASSFGLRQLALEKLHVARSLSSTSPDWIIKVHEQISCVRG